MFIKETPTLLGNFCVDFLYETPLAQIKEIEMKRYTIGLITGILLGASAMMFMRAECPNTYSDN